MVSKWAPLIFYWLVIEFGEELPALKWVTDFIEIKNGLNQGDPFSGILYLLYNSDLPKTTGVKQGKRTLLFVDDAAIISHGQRLHHDTWETLLCYDKIKWHLWLGQSSQLRVRARQIPAPVLLQENHSSSLQAQDKDPSAQECPEASEHVIPSKETPKCLGSVVDNRLDWKAQGAAALAKGQDLAWKFSRIAKVSKGTHTKYFHWLYLSITIPHMLYLLITFHSHMFKSGFQLKKILTGVML